MLWCLLSVLRVLQFYFFQNIGMNHMLSSFFPSYLFDLDSFCPQDFPKLNRILSICLFIFLFQINLGHPWRWAFFQGWTCQEMIELRTIMKRTPENPWIFFLGSLVLIPVFCPRRRNLSRPQKPSKALLLELIHDQLQPCMQDLMYTHWWYLSGRWRRVNWRSSTVERCWPSINFRPTRPWIWWRWQQTRAWQLRVIVSPNRSPPRPELIGLPASWRLMHLVIILHKVIASPRKK